MKMRVMVSFLYNAIKKEGYQFFSLLDFEDKLNAKNKQNTKRKKRKANELEISSDSQSSVNTGNILLHANQMVGILGQKVCFLI